MLEWDRLTVITTEGAVPNQVNWQAEQGVFPAETCARHIYVGLEENFGNVSCELLQNKKTSMYSGAEAYKFYVEFYAGLKGHYHADKAVSGQTRRAWNQYTHRQPEYHKKLKPYMDAMFHDGALVITAVLNQFWHRPTLASTAVKMADISTDSRVLVVCGAEALSAEIITALGHKKTYTPTRIDVTHPDSGALNEIVCQIRKRKGHEAIQAELNQVSFDRALMDDGTVTTMFNASAIFVCQPMTEDKESKLGTMNNALCEAWQLRSMLDAGHGAKIIHLKGDPLKQGRTTGLWNELQDTDGFVPFSLLREKKEERVRFVGKVAERGKEAIRHMAELRTQGDRVVGIAFGANDNDMSLNYVLARRPLGAPAQATAVGNSVVPAGR